jgi:tetratricopeptide (TPR) repeat protein
MSLWVNLHLGFVAGLGMCGTYIFLELAEVLAPGRRPIALRRLRTAAPWLLTTFGATLLNPWGPWNYVGMLRLLPFQSNRWIVELMNVRTTPTTIADALVWRDPRSALFWFIAIAALAALFATYTRRIAAALILAASIYFVIHTARFVGLFATIVVVIGGSLFADALEIEWVRRVPRRISTFIGNRGPAVATLGFLTVVTSFVAIRVWDLVSNRYYMHTPWQFSDFGPGEAAWYPERAAAFVLRERLPGSLFNDYNAGGFVAWALSPEYADYVDGRSVPSGAGLFRSEELLSQSLDSADWEAEAESRKINTILVSVDSEAGGALKTLDKFCDSRRWRPVFLDENGAVFLRVTPDTAELVRRLQIDCRKVRFDGPPASAKSGRAQQFRYLINAAAILIVLDRNTEALQLVERAERIFSDNAFLHYAKGVALDNLGRSTDAERELRFAIDVGSDDAALALARHYEEEGRYAEEVDILSRTAERATLPYLLYLRLAYAQLYSGHPDLALASFDKAERESPFAGDAYSLGTDFRAQIAEGRQRALLESRSKPAP